MTREQVERLPFSLDPIRFKTVSHCSTAPNSRIEASGRRPSEQEKAPKAALDPVADIQRHGQFCPDK